MYYGIQGRDLELKFTVSDKELMAIGNEKVTNDTYITYYDGINTVEKNAYWKAPLIQLQNTTHNVVGDFIIDADKLIIDNTSITAGKFYVVSGCDMKVNNDEDYTLTPEVEYIDPAQMKQMLADWDM